MLQFNSGEHTESSSRRTPCFNYHQSSPVSYFSPDSLGEDVSAKKKLDDIMHLAELCIEVLQQNEEHHAEVGVCPHCMSFFCCLFLIPHAPVAYSWPPSPQTLFICPADYTLSNHRPHRVFLLICVYIIIYLWVFLKCLAPVTVKCSWQRLTLMFWTSANIFFNLLNPSLISK